MSDVWVSYTSDMAGGSQWPAGLGPLERDGALARIDQAIGPETLARRVLVIQGAVLGWGWSELTAVDSVIRW